MNKRSDQDKSKFVRVERARLNEISAFLFALGNQFVNIKNANGAFDCFRYAVDLNEKNASAVYNLGALYSVTGNLQGAKRMFSEASRMQPTDLTCKVALGEVLRKLGETSEAAKILEEVHRLDPEDSMALCAIAILNYDCGNLAEAMAWNDRALEKRPGDIHMILNRTLINMTYGRWPEFWGHYEHCLSYQKNEKMKNLKMSDAWAGQEYEGKTLLVISDQGSGDAIQFSRYLAEAKEKGKFGKIVYLVQPDLRELLSRVDGVDEAIGYSEKMRADYDHYSALLGVMRVLQISPENCWRPPHIKTDPQLDEVWSSRIRAMWDGQSKKVAIVWAGDPKHGNDHARSIPLTQFLKIVYGTSESAAVEGAQLFSFQVGHGTSQLNTAPIDDSIDIVDLGSDFRSFDDTASALKQMDLLITCDTSIAHLAGCMGLPCWILVPNPPEWRWLATVGTTPWYKETRIYRQTTPKNWNPVMESIMRDLHEFVGIGAASA